MPVALKVVLHEPFLMGGALAAIVVLITLPMGPNEARFSGYRLLAELAYYFFMIALSCKAIWRQDALITEGADPDTFHWKAVTRAFVAVVFYSIASTIGLIFFVVPGVVFGVRTALYPVVICLEDRGIVGCFGRSADLTADRFWRTFTYMFAPCAVILLAEWAVPFLLLSVSPNAFRDTTPSLQWILQYPLVATILILCSLAALFAQVSAMPLLTKLYVEYCEEEQAAEQVT